MSSPRIGRNAHSLVVEPARARQTPKPPSTFKAVMHGGSEVLLSGATAASKVIGLPVLSAALARARAGTSTASSAAASPAADGTADLTKAFDQRYDEDLKLLALQDQIQRQNRQVSLVSNVMKSRHDTAKAAISNLRA